MMGGRVVKKDGSTNLRGLKVLFFLEADGGPLK